MSHDSPLQKNVVKKRLALYMHFRYTDLDYFLSADGNDPVSLRALSSYMQGRLFAAFAEKAEAAISSTGKYIC